MKNIAVFPGSFDPFTVGHKSIVDRALNMFDEIIIAIGYNSEKSGFFPIEKRVEWINKIFERQSEISVITYQGLTVEFCRENNANYILRGLRTSEDFEYERAIAQMNKKLLPDTETVFLLTSPEHTPISSSIVREIYKHGGDVSEFIPEGIVLEK